MAKQNPSRIGVIGEHLVLAELLRRGFDAYLAHGTTNKGWDILVFKKDNSVMKEIRVQVKTTSSKKKSKTINLSKASREFSDYTVILLLDIQRDINESSNDKYLILSNEEVEKHLSPYNEERKNNARTISVNGSFEECYLNQWLKIR
ncbi:hypothetical protein [Bacillus wiedmannii]|uniref:hypothetical protein n=1 Tax=Bacillus wiedmannii TaxID=1890302 RepID=UPI000BF5E183|nr:hypothetical protein [Bacillus wiedmannii]MDM5264833.1 hypothetical protein [Bacillus wiedmannii]PFZ86150.1 hypothetical protein COL83_28670 [Bacillus wiedmannii]